MTTLPIDQILAGRKLPQTSIPLCLRLDVMSEIEELERQINALRSGVEDDDPRLVGTETDAAALADRIRELEEVARQYTIDLRIQALEKKEWAAKVAQFTEEDDEGNAKLDMGAVVEHVLTLPGVIISPEMSGSQRDQMIAGLSDGQWETVLKKVFDLNRRTVSVGKSLTASLVTRPKNSTPAPGEK